jgi:hypothetical protein
MNAIAIRPLGASVALHHAAASTMAVPENPPSKALHGKPLYRRADAAHFRPTPIAILSTQALAHQPSPQAKIGGSPGFLAGPMG